MKIATSRTFQYIKLETDGKHFFCLEQNLVVLAWILYFEKGPLRPINRIETKRFSLSFVIRWIRNLYTRFKKNLILLIVFVGYKYQFRKIESALHLHLPFYGQLCLSVHSGYKIFDLYTGKVIKVFDSDVDASRIVREMEALKNISHLDCAPTIRSWNVFEKWYEEDYIAGCLETAQDPASLVAKFNSDVIQHMTSVMLSQKPIRINALEYVDDIIQILSVSRMATEKHLARHFYAIKTFVDSLVERLHDAGEYPVMLVFTHGDFIPNNMLKTRFGIRLVDWEDAKQRSALFDFYSYCFYRAVWKIAPVTKVAAEIQEVLPLCIASLSKNAEEIANSVLELETLYRWLFYIEFVCRLVEREETDKNLNIAELLLLYLEAFNRYEEIRAVKPA